MTGGVALKVLGRPAIEIDGQPVTIATRPLHLVLRLAIDAPTMVSVERLRSGLWPDDTSDSALRVTVNRARKIVGAARIEAAAQAYGITDVSIDSHDFVRLLERARGEAEPDRRLADYAAALALWRGPAFDGMADLAWLTTPAETLDELREQAIDERAGLLISTGALARAISELSLGAERAPLREARIRLLALALYRSGRQAEAFAVITRTRDELRDELGLHLGRDLDELERRMLRHDPALHETPSRERRAPVALQVDARVKAAATLTRAGAFGEARTILETAEREAITGADRAAEARVLLARARLATRSGEDDPHPLIDGAQLVARELGDGQLLARAALLRIGAGVTQDKAAILTQLTEPIALLDETAPERVDLLCAAAVFVMFIDASEAGPLLLLEAERLHAALGTTRTEAIVLIARSIVAAITAPQDVSAYRDAERALTLARTTGDSATVLAAIQAVLRSRYAWGRLTEVDQVLDELAETAKRSALPFGLVRVELCRTTNALARGELDQAAEHRAEAQRLAERHHAAGSLERAKEQQLILMLEHDQRASIVDLALQPIADGPAPPLWRAIAAYCGDAEQAALLSEIASEGPFDDVHPIVVALAAEIAARNHDERLAAHCLEPLKALGEQTVLTGLGTVVLGFAAHFRALARRALGDRAGAIGDLSLATALARDAGAALWEAHSLVEMAEILAAASAGEDRARATAILHELGQGPVVARSARLRRRIDEVTEMSGISAASGVS